MCIKTLGALNLCAHQDFGYLQKDIQKHNGKRYFLCFLNFERIRIFLYPSKFVVKGSIFRKRNTGNTKQRDLTIVSVVFAHQFNHILSNTQFIIEICEHLHSDSEDLFFLNVISSLQSDSVDLHDQFDKLLRSNSRQEFKLGASGSKFKSKDQMLGLLIKTR